jgi:integrase
MPRSGLILVALQQHGKTFLRAYGAQMPRRGHVDQTNVEPADQAAAMASPSRMCASRGFQRPQTRAIHCRCRSSAESPPYRRPPPGWGSDVERAHSLIERSVMRLGRGATSLPGTRRPRRGRAFPRLVLSEYPGAISTRSVTAAGAMVVKSFLLTVRKKRIVPSLNLGQGGFIVAKSHLTLVSPNTVNRTVTPLRRPNADHRKREHLTPGEVEALIEAAKGNRYGHRDATMVLLAYRHGLRACELVDLEWSQIDFKASVLHVRRAKKGTPATHPLRGDEMRALRKLQRESTASSFLFVSERGASFSPGGFAKMIERAGAEAGLRFKAHPHMLRHACGFALANAGHDTRALQAYLGHKNIQHTVRYTELAPNRFKDFWR